MGCDRSSLGLQGAAFLVPRVFRPLMSLLLQVMRLIHLLPHARGLLTAMPNTPVLDVSSLSLWSRASFLRLWVDHRLIPQVMSRLKVDHRLMPKKSAWLQGYLTHKKPRPPRTLQ